MSKVLVGVVKSKAQLEVNLDSLFYHTPANNVPVKHFPIDYVALYQSSSHFSDNGIRYIGEVIKGEKVSRGDITELPTDTPDAIYYRFDVRSWTELNPPIKLEDKLFVCAVSELDSIFKGRLQVKDNNSSTESDDSFCMTRDQINNILVTEHTVSISQLADRINACYAEPLVQPLKIIAWLFNNKLLCLEPDENGKTKVSPSRLGNGIGIVSINKIIPKKGVISTIVYRESAQRFIIDKINGIMNDEPGLWENLSVGFYADCCTNGLHLNGAGSEEGTGALIHSSACSKHVINDEYSEALNVFFGSDV